MSPSHSPNRWIQLLIGIVGMVAVTSLQYRWTLFVGPMQDKYSWSEKDIQVAFTLFVFMETWLVPVEAYLADRFGARRLVFLGGLLVAVSWTMNSVADSLPWLYLGNSLGGMGVGMVYGITIGNALRWFPDRRGLAAGLTAAAFGAGSALTVFPIQAAIDHAGYEKAFLWFGLGQGTLVLLVALIMRTPHALAHSAGGTGVPPAGRDLTPMEMVRAPVFWLLYAMMTMVTVGGLLAIAQLAPMARSLGVAHVPFLFLGYTMTALSLALFLESIMSGVTRPIFGWVSDHIGRENTMFLAFSLEAVATFCLIWWAHVPEMFVCFSALTLFFWGEIYSLFPATCGNLFGRQFAATNYALLYTAKGTASLLVPLGSYLFEVTGSWTPIFALAIAFDLIVAILALVALRPLRKRWLAANADNPHPEKSARPAIAAT